MCVGRSKIEWILREGTAWIYIHIEHTAGDIIQTLLSPSDPCGSLAYSTFLHPAPALVLFATPREPMRITDHHPPRGDCHDVPKRADSVSRDRYWKRVCILHAGCWLWPPIHLLIRRSLDYRTIVMTQKSELMCFVDRLYRWALIHGSHKTRWMVDPYQWSLQPIQPSQSDVFFTDTYSGSWAWSLFVCLCSTIIPKRAAMVSCFPINLFRLSRSDRWSKNPYFHPCSVSTAIIILIRT